SDWEEYCERFENFIKLNKIPEDDKLGLLLALIGPKMYGILKTLVNGQNPGNLPFKMVKSLLDDHFSPQPLVISERYKFMNLSQEEGESLRDFALRLQKHSEKCDFGSFLDDALRDNGHVICPLGTAEVTVTANGKEMNLQVYVCENSTSLIGRDCLGEDIWKKGKMDTRKDPRAGNETLKRHADQILPSKVPLKINDSKYINPWTSIGTHKSVSPEHQTFARSSALSDDSVNTDNYTDESYVPSTEVSLRETNQVRRSARLNEMTEAS
ncbi:hypothetical protein HZS_3423, partial [Henneguya salminicola]